jgi:hypothetical protein
MTASPNQAIRRRTTRVSAMDLFAEGVFELGRVPDTSVLFVETEERTFLIHVECLDRRGRFKAIAAPGQA